MKKPSIPKGTRDFTPTEMNRRNYIFDTIISLYKLFGYEPIETPAMEKLETLLGKYGEEGDKLLFKILNSGDYLSKADHNLLQDKNSQSLTTQISEKGLRYDLTVPFARFVVQHRNDLSFPFKRYQIQPVWRADRPQKGRYREFYQCDADVIGSDSLINEVELLQMMDEVFKRLKIETSIVINNRKILSGIANYIGYPEQLIDMTVAIDKLDKIGMEKVCDELTEKGFSAESIEKLQHILALQGTNHEKLDRLSSFFEGDEVGLKGIEEMQYIFDKLSLFSFSNEVLFDITLARGLNYYTGSIFEVKAKNTNIGSICGGGRYDDLTGVFGLKNMSGVGMSFGADRIYDVMNNEGLFPENISTTTQIMFVNFGEKEQNYCLPIIQQLRSKGIAAEIYPESAKMKKQMSYADNKNIPFVAMVGENEINESTISLKNMKTGTQEAVSFENLLEIIVSK